MIGFRLIAPLLGIVIAVALWVDGPYGNRGANYFVGGSSPQKMLMNKEFRQDSTIPSLDVQGRTCHRWRDRFSTGRQVEGEVSEVEPEE